MEEDKEISIILGRPFLAIGRAMIDVQKGELTMRVNEQDVTFNISKFMKYRATKIDNECFRMEICDYIRDEHFKEKFEEKRE